MGFDFFDATLQDRTLDVFGVENGILDYLVRIDEVHLGELGLTKGTMKLVDTEEQAVILEHVGGLEPEIEAGGSCANVLRVASQMGCRVSYSSAVGRDLNGALFAQELARAGVTDCLARVEGVTGTSIILVTDDGERTMNTHLGVCREYRRDFLPLAEIRRCKIFFTTAYIWDTPNQIEAIEAALVVARQARCRLVVDLADPFAVDRSRDALLGHIEEGLDLLFANGEEAKIMTGLDPEAACRDLAAKVRVAVVKDGADGAFIGHREDLIHVEAHPVEVVDTTGAGDCFAAGFLTGLVGGKSLEVCGRLATLLAADTIGHLGVKLSPDIASKVEALFGGPDEGLEHASSLPITGRLGT